MAAGVLSMSGLSWYAKFLTLSVLAYLFMQLFIPRLSMPEPDDNIAKNATRDLSHIGQYDNTTEVSIRYWTYAIEVAIYEVDKSFDTLTMLLSWNKEHNFDRDGYIEEGIQAAHTLFLNEIEQARTNNTEVKFGVSDNYDWHVYPLSFYNNEFLDPDKLINIVDNIIGR